MGIYNKVFILCLVILLISCETGNVRQQGIRVPERYGASEYSQLSDQAKRRYLREYHFFPERAIDKIIKNEIFKGMTTDQALFSWGRPDNIEQRDGSWGTIEKWLYGIDSQGHSYKYLLFKDGRLDDWKE